MSRTESEKQSSIFTECVIVPVSNRTLCTFKHSISFYIQKLDLLVRLDPLPPCLQLLSKDDDKEKREPEFHLPNLGPKPSHTELIFEDMAKLQVYLPKTGLSHVAQPMAHSCYDHLRMNVAPDQTIIFLSFRLSVFLTFCLSVFLPLCLVILV